MVSLQAGQILLAALESVSIIFHHLPASTQSVITRNLTVIGLPDTLPQLHTSKLQILGAVILLVGARLRLSAFARLGRFFRFEISIQRAHKLITSGPYAYVRHPAYTGLLLMCLGWVCYHLAPGSWLHESSILESLPGLFLVSIYLGGGLLFMLIVTLGRMWKEEGMLQVTFEKEWEEWAEKVPCRLIPGIY